MAYGVLFSTKLLGQGDFAQAIDQATKEIVASPDEPESFFNRGQALAALGRLDEAAADYEAALAMDASGSTMDPEAVDDELFFVLRSLATAQKARPAEAIATLQRYRRVLPAGRHLDDIETWVDHVNDVEKIWVRERA